MKIIRALLCFFLLTFVSSQAAIIEVAPVYAFSPAFIGSGAGGGCTGTYGYEAGASELPYLTGEIILNQVSHNCSGSSGTIYADIKDLDTTDREAIFVIYDDDGGSNEPGTLLWNSSAALYDVTSTSAWKELSDSIGSTINSTNGTIWFGVYSESSAGLFKYTSGTGQVRRKTISGTFGTGNVPATWDTAGDSESTALRNYWIIY